MSGKSIPLGVRHGQVFLLFGSILTVMLTRLDLSVAIVAMTDSPSEYQMFNWSPAEKGVLLGMYFNGFVLATLPSGFVANRSRVRYLLSASGFVSGLLALGFPYTATSKGYKWCCAARVLLGTVQGVVFPCVSAHLSKWSTLSERQMFTPLAYCGVPLGAVVVHSASGFLAASRGGWPAIFYASGSCSIIWGAICFWFIRDFPSEHKGISKEERSYIQRNTKQNSNKSEVIPMPWKSVMTSKPVWALVCSATSYFWGLWMMDTMLPTYMRDVHKMDVANNGVLSALPHLGMLVSCLLSPILAHYFAICSHVSLTFQRKFWNSVGLLGGGLCFLLLGTTRNSSTVAVIILAVANFLLASVHIGFKTNVLDLAPNFSALVTGIANGLGTLLPLFAPTLIGFIQQANPDPVSAWSKIFVLATAINAFGGIVFLIFASAVVQKWNDVESTEKMGTSVETLS